MDREYVERITRDLMSKGRLIEAGWIGFRYAAVPLSAHPVQVEEMRNAFFAGTQHLFASMTGAFDPDGDATADDVNKLYMIRDELNNFMQEYSLKHSVPKGSA